MSALPMVLPPASVPAGLVRESQLLHHYDTAEVSAALRPYSPRSALVDPLSVRNGNAWSVASDGRTYRTPADCARFEWFDLDGDGILETPFLVVEDAETNLVAHSDVLTSWTPTGTIAAVAAHTLGEAQTYRLTDSDGAVSAFFAKATTAITGATAKGLRLIWGAGTTPAASGAFARIRDTTNNVDRLNATITANGDGSPNVAIVGGAGVNLAARYLRTVDDVKYFAIPLASNALTGGAGHEVRLGAAVTGAQTGNVHFGAVTMTDEPRVASYIDRPGTGAISRAREVIGWAAPFVGVGAQTWLLDLLEVGALQVAGAIVAALTDANGANPSVRVEVSGGNRYQITHHNGTSSVVSTVSAAPAFGDRVRLVATLFADGSVQIGQGVNGGAVAYATRSAALKQFPWGAGAGVGWWLQPTATLSKAKTRLRRWKVAGAVLTEAQLANRW